MGDNQLSLDVGRKRQKIHMTVLRVWSSDDSEEVCEHTSFTNSFYVIIAIMRQLTDF